MHWLCGLRMVVCTAASNSKLHHQHKCRMSTAQQKQSLTLYSLSCCRGSSLLPSSSIGCAAVPSTPPSLLPAAAMRSQVLHGKYVTSPACMFHRQTSSHSMPINMSCRQGIASRARSAGGLQGSFVHRMLFYAFQSQRRSPSGPVNSSSCRCQGLPGPSSDPRVHKYRHYTATVHTCTHRQGQSLPPAAGARGCLGPPATAAPWPAHPAAAAAG